MRGSNIISCVGLISVICSFSSGQAFSSIWGETGSYITPSRTNIKFCVDVSVQSTRKSSPWLAGLVLVQLLAVSTRHSTAGLWSVTLRPIHTERVYVCRATRVYAHMEHMLKRPARSHQAPLRASALKMEHGSILSASAPVHGCRRARCEWAFKRHTSTRCHHRCRKNIGGQETSPLTLLFSLCPNYLLVLLTDDDDDDNDADE